MVTQVVTVALRVRAMGSRTAIANGILISMSAIHTNARRFDRSAPNFQRMTPEERSLGRGGLYRFYDADQRPLYFGISSSFEIRWDAHRLKAPWWPIAEYVALSFYAGTRHPLHSHETAAIRRERPPFNRKTQGANRPRLAPPLPSFAEGG
jgi:hypothetical protein